MRWFESIKESVFLKVIKKGAWYTIVVLVMCLSFAIYPHFLQDWIFGLLRDRIDTSLLSPVMGLIPLVWISLVGLLISWVNTISYCIIDIDGSRRKWNIFIAVAAIFIIILMVIVCDKGYYEVKCLLSNCDNLTPLVILKRIYKVFQSFTEGVTALTFVTFGFFGIIDIFDTIYYRRKIKTCTDEEKASFIIEQKSSRSQFWLIDVTVLLSSAMLWWFSNKIDYSYLSREMVEGEFYTNVFMTGAWGIQIVISQLVFYILTMQYYYDKQCVKIENKRIKEERKKRSKKKNNLLRVNLIKLFHRKKTIKVM